MEKQTVFVKRYPKNGELPNKDGWYFTNRGLYFIYISNLSYIKECEYFLEEIELPSEEESAQYVDKCMSNENKFKVVFKDGFTTCYNFIINKLKGESK